MAWDEIAVGGVTGFTGDKPMDEFGLAFKRVAEHYEARFGRKPYVFEAIYALDAVMGERPHALFSDHAGMANAKLSVSRPSDPTKIRYPDMSRLEGAYSEAFDPPRYVVFEKTDGAERDILHVPVLEDKDSVPVCEFDRLDPDMSFDEAEAIIRRVLLKEYLDGSFADQAKSMLFVDRRSGERRKGPMND